MTKCIVVGNNAAILIAILENQALSGETSPSIELVGDHSEDLFLFESGLSLIEFVMVPGSETQLNGQMRGFERMEIPHLNFIKPHRDPLPKPPRSLSKLRKDPFYPTQRRRR